jgi:heat shock protein HslJ
MLMLRHALPFAVSCLLALGGFTASAQNATITGTVAYLQHNAPPSNAGAVSTPLEGTHWTLTKIGGQAIAPATGRREAYLQFVAQGRRVTGSTGCNRLTGAYEQAGSGLKFHPIATTMMACIGQVMTQENKFNAALRKTDSYRIRGNTLLLIGKKKVLASFNAAPSEGTNPEK